MTDPFADDSWDELSRELGVEKATTTPPREPEPEVPDAEFAFADDHSGIEVDSQAEEGEFDGDLGEEADGDAPDGVDVPGDERPGPGRKRRRRRRRRKKGPGGEGEAGEGAPTEEPVEPVAPARPVRAPAPVRVLAPVRQPREEPAYAEAEYDSGSEELEPVGNPHAIADEDTAGEVLREMIANWNVPSWDAIITGLNRPH